MWKAVTLILMGLLASGFCSITYGPCHSVNTVEVDTKKWPGKNFVNVMTKNEGVRCVWVDRHIEYADGNSSNTAKENVIVAEVFYRIENGTQYASNVAATYAGQGHYQFTATIGGSSVTFEAYWMNFALPDLECHFICSDNALFKSYHGTIFCESTSADALSKNACEIKTIAESNGFNVSDLMMVDNCDCPNVSFEYESSCGQVSVTDYFSTC